MKAFAHFWRTGCWLLAFVILSVALGSNGHAADATTSFDQANRLYEQGKFTDAAAAYESMLRAGQTAPALYFNLGNAWFKAGQLGRAILSYRLAERLAPRDPDIRANLRFARNTVAAGAARPVPLWRRWAGRLSLDEWTGLTGALVWIWFTLLILGQLRPSLRSVMRRYIALAGISIAIAAVGLFLVWRDNYATLAAVVIMREPMLRHGPLDESPSLQTLHDGEELTVMDQKDNWLQVAGAARGIGWLKRDQVIVLAP